MDVQVKSYNIHAKNAICDAPQAITPQTIHHARCDALLSSYQVKINQLMINCLIGIYEHEKTIPQPVEINLEVHLDCPKTLASLDNYDTVFCYHNLIKRIQSHTQLRHIGLVESLARDIAYLCFDDPKVTCVSVEVLKPNAIETVHHVGAKLTFTRP